MADQEADRILENARSESARALDEARSEADRIRVDAQANAEEARQEGTDLLERARTESDRLLSGLAERRQNLVVQLGEMRGKLIAVGPFTMSLGVVVWPVVFLTTDIINEYFGKPGVRRLTLLTVGLILYAFLVIFGALQIPAAKISPVDDASFRTVLGQSLWIIVGSVTAFLVSQLVDVMVFWVFRDRTAGRHLWLRATGSTASKTLTVPTTLTSASKSGRRTEVGTSACAARWKQTSGPASVNTLPSAGSRMSSSTRLAADATFSRLPELRSSRTTTSSPRASRASTRFEPMKPAPPVTKSRIAPEG